MQGISGAIGKQVVHRLLNGKSFVSKFPDMSQVKYNAVQLSWRGIFADAAQFASKAMQHPAQKARYARMGGISPYHAAIREYMRLHRADASENPTQTDWKQFPGSQELNDRQRKAMAYLIKKKQLTNSLYQQIKGVSKATATRDLQEMVKKQFIRFSSMKGAGARYHLADLPA